MLDSRTLTPEERQSRPVVQVDKGIPMPKPYYGHSQPAYPWVSMDVGDSFVILARPRSAYTMASKAGKEYGFKFSVRKCDGVLRVWRVA